MKTILKPIVFFVFTLLCFSTNAQTNEQQLQNTLQVYLSALKSANTAQMADLMHPDALVRLRDVFDRAFNGAKSEQAQKDLLPLFEVSSLSEYQALTNKEAFKRLNDTIAKTTPNFAQIMASMSSQILSVYVEDGVGYIFFEMAFNVEGQTVKQEEVQKLKSNGDKWLLLLPSTADQTIAQVNGVYN